MSYQNYYINQSGGGGLPVFEGVRIQKGFGLGGLFRRFFRWVVPIIQKHALPVAKTVGQEVVKGVSNLALDSIEGKKLDESSKERFNETIKNIKERVQSGSGKRKRNIKKKNKVIKFIKKSDIFGKICQ